MGLRLEMVNVIACKLWLSLALQWNTGESMIFGLA